MDIITSKEIKNFILDPTNNLDDLYDYLEKDFNNTIEGIFSALYKLLLRNYDQNKSRSNYLISIIESIIDELTPEQVKHLNGCIENLNNNIVSNIKKKERIKINEPVNRINEIHNKAANKLLIDSKSKKIKLLQYLIFQERNLYLIDQNINGNTNVLNYRDKDGANIFSIVLENYLYLNETNEEEIEYLYNVILLFIESKYGSEIINDSARYKRIIKKSKLEYKEHVIKEIELFDKKFKLTTEDIEERYNIRFNFPNIVYNELNSFIMDNNERYNFTSQECITIDGENDICLDDAFYIERNKDETYTLYIHIADIPAFVPYTSTTNIEAAKRIETLYLRDSSIPLYPDEISNKLCSLLPNNNRNVITCIYHLDSKLNLIDPVPTIVKGKINVKHKLGYHEVDARFKNLTDTNLDKILVSLYLFSLNQKKQNPEKTLYRALENFIEFETHHESLKIDTSPSANIVHETMILNNHGIGRYMMENNIPYTYRELYIPTEDFINQQIKKINSLGENIEHNKTFINNLKDSYLKAKYTWIPTRHKGLNLFPYSHSTSPLRRYNDAHNQYIIHDCIFNGHLDDLSLQAWEYRNQQLINYINKQKEKNEIFQKHYNYLSYKKLIKKK